MNKDPKEPLVTSLDAQAGPLAWQEGPNLHATV